MTTAIMRQADIAHVWAWLAEVPDPEIPAVSIVDLGIVRAISWKGEGAAAELMVAYTPTYSGCPAMGVIALDIETALRRRGIARFRLEQRIAPPWTTDWISAEGRRKLLAYGIAPPVEGGRPAPGLDRLLRRPVVVACPRCGASDTARISEFGSTACKAQYQCRACLEPFDYFKCI